MTVGQIESLASWQRRAIALAALAAVVLALLLLVWPATAMVLGHEAWREDAAETLARHRALADSSASIKSELATAEAHAVWGSLFPGTDTAAAANALQSEFRSLCDALKVPVQGSAPLDPEVGERLIGVGIRLDLQVTIDQLQSLLERVQSNPHRLALDNVTITAPRYQSAEQNPTLQVQVEVRGFIRKPEARTGAAS